MIQKTIKVDREAGLDARAISKIVETASHFHSDLFLTYKDHKVNVKSIMGVLSLGIPDQADITVEASGRDEGNALQRVIETIRTLA